MKLDQWTPRDRGRNAMLMVNEFNDDPDVFKHADETTPEDEMLALGGFNVIEPEVGSLQDIVEDIIRGPKAYDGTFRVVDDTSSDVEFLIDREAA